MTVSVVRRDLDYTKTETGQWVKYFKRWRNQNDSTSSQNETAVTMMSYILQVARCIQGA